MTGFSFVDSPRKLEELDGHFRSDGIQSIAMDFEEESNLHVYGEHLCLVQLSDGKDFHVIDALELGRTEEGVQALRTFLEGPVQKIMFDCSSDAAIVRKTLGIHLKNIYDIRLVARALGFEGNLIALIQRNLGIGAENPGQKKKYQRANWMQRPLPQAQLDYALDDVKYLFALKESLEAEMHEKLPLHVQRRILASMKYCALPKHRDRPGWEKICNYRALSYDQKIYIKYFFNARDALAREANTPAANILGKQLVVEMAKAGTWQGILQGDLLRYADFFENARLDAVSNLESCISLHKKKEQKAQWIV